jgi:hypothetical protein
MTCDENRTLDLLLTDEKPDSHDDEQYRGNVFDQSNGAFAKFTAPSSVRA